MYKCPKCGSTGLFNVSGIIEASGYVNSEGDLTEDPCQDIGSDDMVWDSWSCMTCNACEFDGVVIDFIN